MTPQCKVQKSKYGPRAYRVTEFCFHKKALKNVLYRFKTSCFERLCHKLLNSDIKNFKILLT